MSSYAGLVPSTYQTGDREYQGKITKRGSTELRSMLCEAAHQANKPQHPLVEAVLGKGLAGGSVEERERD